MAINEEEEKKSCLTLPVTGAGSTTVNKWVNLVCTVGQECKTAEGHKEGKRSGCKNPIKQCDHGSELNKCCVDPDLGTPEKISNILNYRTVATHLKSVYFELPKLCNSDRREDIEGPLLLN